MDRSTLQDSPRFAFLLFCRLKEQKKKSSSVFVPQTELQNAKISMDRIVEERLLELLKSSRPDFSAEQRTKLAIFLSQKIGNLGQSPLAQLPTFTPRPSPIIEHVPPAEKTVPKPLTVSMEAKPLPKAKPELEFVSLPSKYKPTPPPPTPTLAVAKKEPRMETSAALVERKPTVTEQAATPLTLEDELRRVLPDEEMVKKLMKKVDTERKEAGNREGKTESAIRRALSDPARLKEVVQFLADSEKERENLPLCPYGEGCRKTNPDHLIQYAHPKKEKKDKKKKEDSDEDEGDNLLNELAQDAAMLNFKNEQKVHSTKASSSFIFFWFDLISEQ
jgi:hypothetical protein